MATPTDSPPRIRACIFDMDGLLINSEDLITESINRILHSYSRPSLPWSVKVHLQGRTLAESSRILLEWAQLPISEAEFQDRLKDWHVKLFPTCRPLPGVERLLQTLSESEMQLALATSSRRDKFELKSQHLQELFAPFKPAHRVLGDDGRIPPGRHKPEPDIYVLALKCINETVQARGGDLIRPEECLVFEDAVQGVAAGRRAGMHVIWCPHEGLYAELERIDGVDEVSTGPLTRDPRETTVKLHPATLVRSLEDFDYGKYGIMSLSP